MKYKKRNNSHKANVASKFKFHKKKKTSYQCAFCKMSGHSADYWYTNSLYKRYKGGEVFEKPSFQLPTSAWSNQGLQRFTEKVVVDSKATGHFFCSWKMFIAETGPHSSFLECASGNLFITEVSTVHLTTKTIMTIDNAVYTPELTVNLLTLLKVEKKGVWYTFDKSIRSLKLSSRIFGNLEILSDPMNL